jgi:hypothetical protein
MRVLWCDREKSNAPSFMMMRRQLKSLVELTVVYSKYKYNMPHTFSEKNYDAIIVGPFAADLNAWSGLEHYSIPKIMICSDPLSDVGHHVFYARKYKIDNLWFLYPSYIPFYQKYLSNVKYDSLPWWISDLKTNAVKKIDVTYTIGNSPFNPIRFLMTNDSRYSNAVKFGIGPDRLEWVDYYNILKQSKLLVFDGSIYNYPILKFIEGMMMECCMLAPTPESSEILKLKEYENFVPINTENYHEKIQEYLHNEEMRQKIAANARKTYLENHTTEIRARQIVEKLEKIINGQIENGFNQC